ncbi:hypothetical protein Poly51_52450 [Rubripirellula tenax]|uniref:DUF2141 domain-containing protein n=1 Tax=Rubripirellula tenax TaxID=2528015 RepID=A0A5C6EG03_9BACT|nr:DUF2141 domain-containing protein [Rubripirellula tenax]TWU47445.1 hypothetical protein Poly51_52450 [Rubripirellula tenax]
MEPHEPSAPPSLWQENHGNLLLGFAVLVTIGGAMILLYIQNRFVPPRFPNEASIVIPDSPDGVETPVDGNAISVSLMGAANDEGTFRLAFYENSESFNDVERAFLRTTAPIKDGECRIRVGYEMIPEEFAVAAYHDENDNGVLDRNRLGIPTERYGFSSNARGLTGPPDYEEATVQRPEVGGSITIAIR